MTLVNFFFVVARNYNLFKLEKLNILSSAGVIYNTHFVKICILTHKSNACFKWYKSFTVVSCFKTIHKIFFAKTTLHILSILFVDEEESTHIICII